MAALPSLQELNFKVFVHFHVFVFQVVVVVVVVETVSFQADVLKYNCARLLRSSDAHQPRSSAALIQPADNFSVTY